jgi:tRNA-Thr(GGU) m(6)t(6)A37 methyltransferase TsaA
MEFVMRSIGIIRSPFIEKSKTPIQPTRSKAKGWVDVYKEFADGLQDIEGFSHVILLYVFHGSPGYQLLVKPYLDRQLRGLFSTRYPCRPNPIGLSIVELLGREGTRLEIGGVDILDKTPLLDIKPYIPDFDLRMNVRTGWYANRSDD